MPFANSGTMRKYLVYNSWQVLKSELVSRVPRALRGKSGRPNRRYLRKGEARVGGDLG